MIDASQILLQAALNDKTQLESYDFNRYLAMCKRIYDVSLLTFMSLLRIMIINSSTFSIFFQNFNNRYQLRFSHFYPAIHHLDIRKSAMVLITLIKTIQKPFSSKTRKL